MKMRLAVSVALGLTALLSIMLLGPGKSSAIMLTQISPLTVTFTYAPQDPSIYDTITFTDATIPPSLPFVAYNWNFGDTQTAGTKIATHKYAADGAYQVIDTASAGNSSSDLLYSGSSQKYVTVATHDVAVSQVTAPLAGKPGRSGQVVVSVTNQRYGESVQVQLQKSDAGGFTPVTTLTQSVPVQPSGGAPARFTFPYMFTDGDDALGQVVFRAVATIVGPRDAQPANNQRDSSATRMLKQTLYLPIGKKN